MSTVFEIVMGLLLLSLTVVTARLIRGPSVADRAIATDQIAIHGVALIAVHSAASDQPILLDLVIVTAVVGFITVAVVGVYLARTERQRARMDHEEAGQ